MNSRGLSVPISAPQQQLHQPQHDPAIGSLSAYQSAATGFPFGYLGQRAQFKPPSPEAAIPNANDFDGLSPSSPGLQFSIDSGKKKRGRPRKYAPDGNIALGLSPSAICSVNRVDSGGGVSGMGSETQAKRNRGRPPGSGKRQLDALGIGGVGFTPHVITLSVGEDIASKVIAFSQEGPRTVCILSANGAVSNATLSQQAVCGGTVTYEGRFEIISLSGSFLFSDIKNNQIGGLSVSLAGSDGRVLGGGVAGQLIAASPVQVIVGSFISDGKKSKPYIANAEPSLAAVQPPTLDFGQPATTCTPQRTSSDSSDANACSPPLHPTPTVYPNTSRANSSIHMYQLWADQNQH